MADSNLTTPPDPDWNGIIYFFFITLITLGAEWGRRLLPPPKRNRRKTDRIEVEDDTDNYGNSDYEFEGES